jgi:nucleotide-binding universal stress UspA family protein
MYMDYMGAQKEQEEQMLHEAAKKLNMIREAIRGSEGMSIETQMYTGYVKENILAAVENTKADIVVMGTMGAASGTGGKVWGTKTASVTGKSNVPVIAVPYSYTWKMPGEILFATNRFEKDPGLLTHLFEIARLFKSRIHAVVFTDEDSAAGADFVEHSRELKSYEYFLQQKFPGQQIITAHLSGSSFEETLQDYTDSNGIDMVAMVSLQRGFLSRVIHPSVTRSMAYHTAIPLLVIPDKAHTSE